jgi:hypothetical protein
MLLAWALPARAPRSDLIWGMLALCFTAVFVFITVWSIITMVSYMRWTGKYPYYFLFRKSADTVHRLGDETDGGGDTNKG